MFHAKVSHKVSIISSFIMSGNKYMNNNAKMYLFINDIMMHLQFYPSGLYVCTSTGKTNAYEWMGQKSSNGDNLKTLIQQMMDV